MSVIDLSTLSTTQGFRIDGALANDVAGVSVSSAGDVNNDGINDIIIGAYMATTANGQTGAIYVVYGKSAGESFGAGLDLANLSPTDGFRIDGLVENDRLGASVSAAGDVNGDGVDDLIIGADKANAGYVVFGQTGGFGASFDLTTLDGTNGFRLDGASDSLTGISVSAAGDVNGDEFDDIIISAPHDNSSAVRSGTGYIIFGKDTGFAPTLSLDTPTNANSLRIIGAAFADQLGYSASAAGDVNGDGIDDFIIGAHGADPNGSKSGATYIIYGKNGEADFASDIELSALTATDGVRIIGAASDDFSGYSVSSAGDVNGDGIDDIIIGALYADQPDRSNAGAAFVVFGAAGGLGSDLNLSALNGANGFRINGEAAGDMAGFSVSNAGDVNGDGIDDIIIGTPIESTAGAGAGASYVIFGKAAGESFAPTLDLDTLSETEGFRIIGAAAGDGTGGSISAAGDLNGDGIDDIIIGASSLSPQERTGAGGAYVVFGFRSLGEGDDRVQTGDVGENIDGLGGNDTLLGGAGNDTLIGGAGNDSIAGGGGVNHIDGGSGNDSVSFDGDFADYTLAEAAGGGVTISRDGEETTVVNVESFAFADQTLTYAEILAETPEPGPSTTPTEGADLLTGDAGDNLIDGLGGDDTILGLAGDDTLIGGAGDDSIAGGSGVNYIDGGAGEDTARFDGDFEDYELAEAENGVTLSRTGEQTTVTDVESFDFADQRLSFAQVQDSIAQNGPEEDSNAGSGAGSDTGSDPNAPAGGPTEGPDRLIGDAGANFIFGLGGDDTIMGLDGNDTLRGDPGDDLLIGGAGDDHIRGLAGRDKLKGGAGSDTLKGNGGDDTLIGGAGDDTLNGGGGSDLLKGGGAHDILRGNGGDDALRGNGGNDTLKGGKGNDTLKGGAGADRIFGDKGDDLLKGGKGADVFVFKLKDGDDIIADFTIGEDRIEFRRGIDGFGDISITQKGGHTLIEYGEDESIRLRKISADALSADDFIF